MAEKWFILEMFGHRAAVQRFVKTEHDLRRRRAGADRSDRQQTTTTTDTTPQTSGTLNVTGRRVKDVAVYSSSNVLRRYRFNLIVLKSCTVYK